MHNRVSLQNLLLAVLTLMVVGCGSVDVGTGSGFALSATASDIKSVTFSWPNYPGADYYRLFINPDGVSGYSQLSGDVAETSVTVSIPVHLTRWMEASYRVEAYDAGGVLAATAPLSITPLMLDTIGYLKASNTGSGDMFGYRVALSGDGTTLAVAATGEDSISSGIDGDQQRDLASDAGAVYLYTHTSLGWVQQAYLKASNTEANDHFGSSLALSHDGNTLAVGATGEDSAATGINGNQTLDSASDAGAVYLFTRSATTWSQQAYIKASNTDDFDAFGTSVSLSSDGHTLAVGAVGEDSGATGINGNQTLDIATDSGAVYLFTRSGTLWSQQAYLKASNTQNGDAFGGTLALSYDGNTLAVGAVGEDSAATGINGNQTLDTATDAGAVYLFTRSAATWSQQAYLKASNSEASDAFGTSVALSGDGATLAVGAVGEDSAATGIDGNQTLDLAADSGAVYLFKHSLSGWSQQSYIKSNNSDPFDHFGGAVALDSDGNVLAVAAELEDGGADGVGGDPFVNNVTDSGAVYLYTQSAGLWSLSNYVKAPNSDALDHFGPALALSSDGNTLLVGAVGEDSTATGINGELGNNDWSMAGAAYLY